MSEPEMLNETKCLSQGQTLEAEVEAEAKFNRQSPRPKLKKSEQNTIFHNENICHKNTLRSLMLLFLK